MIYDPRDTNYKNPYGAVPSGTEIRFSIKPPRSMGVRSACLCARFECSAADYEVPLEWTALCGGDDQYVAGLETGDYRGLVWYHFKLTCGDGVQYVDKSGVCESPDRPMQITVYDPAFQQISWFGEGIIYQIFPDRFYRSALPETPQGKSVHKSWDELPAWESAIAPRTGREVWNSDFFGGDLAGILLKLDYLRELGVSVLYLNPIFASFSNHRYDTGDYERIDPLLGDEADFRRLCRAACARGMRVILDGVFSHTGADSRYFNREGSYADMGACQSPDSPYYKWYDFQEYPDRYTAWWGVESLPAVNELEPSYMDYIIENEDSIIRRWLLAGADGWRLDVADELPDAFIEKLSGAAKSVKADAIVIGEVWEDASNKTSYGARRRHLHGGHLDCVMNYPFRDAVIAYLKGGDPAAFTDAMESLRENYPPAAFMNSMNFLSTHDTPRIITVLGAEGHPSTRGEQAVYKLTEAEYTMGKKRLMLGALILFAFPGAPTIYYGDEAGVCGFGDPFNRTTYPWGHEDNELVKWYRRLAKIRNGSGALKRGDITYHPVGGKVLAFSRRSGGETVFAAVNAGDSAAYIPLPWQAGKAADLLSGKRLETEDGRLKLPPLTGVLVRRGHGTAR